MRGIPLSGLFCEETPEEPRVFHFLTCPLVPLTLKVLPWRFTYCLLLSMATGPLLILCSPSFGGVNGAVTIVPTDLLPRNVRDPGNPALRKSRTQPVKPGAGLMCVDLRSFRKALFKVGCLSLSLTLFRSRESPVSPCPSVFGHRGLFLGLS